MRRYFTSILLLCVMLGAETKLAQPEPSFDNPRQVVFSIKSAEDAEINHVLNSANNILKFYGSDNVQIRIVAYYHGIKALQSVHKDIALRVRALMLINVEFVACENTMITKNIKEDELVEGSEIVTAGIAEIIERVKDGWINIVP